MNFYNPSSNFYIISNTLFEYQGTSDFAAVKNYNFVYHSTNLHNPQNVGLLILDIIRLGILVFFNLIVAISSFKEARRDKKCNIYKVVQNQASMFVFLVLFMTAMIILYLNPSPDPSGLSETQSTQVNSSYYDLVTPG